MADDIIFGIRPVLEAIESGRSIERVFFKKDADGRLLGELREVCRQQRIATQDVPVEKLDRLTRLNHQGVVARMAAIGYVELPDLLASIPEGQTPLLVLCDGVTDVRNFGAIARSAECAGAHGLIVPLKNAAPVNAEAIKSSAGALNIIPVCRVGSIRNTIRTLQAEGMQAVAATEKANKELFWTDMTPPTVLVMGSEDVGISKEVLKLCDAEVAIPMRGRVGSLNVSAAAAVMLFEVVRQRLGKK